MELALRQRIANEPCDGSTPGWRRLPALSRSHADRPNRQGRHANGDSQPNVCAVRRSSVVVTRNLRTRSAPNRFHELELTAEVFLAVDVEELQA